MSCLKTIHFRTCLLTFTTPTVSNHFSFNTVQGVRLWTVWLQAKLQPKATLEKHCATNNLLSLWSCYLWDIYWRHHFLRRLEKCADARNLILLLSKWEFNTGFPKVALVNCESPAEVLARNIEEQLWSLELTPVNYSRAHSLLISSPLTTMWLRGPLQSYFRRAR